MALDDSRQALGDSLTALKPRQHHSHPDPDHHCQSPAGPRFAQTQQDKDP